MTQDNAWMWYRALRAQAGLWRKKQWIKGQKAWRQAHPEPKDGYICVLCGWHCRPTQYKRDWQPVLSYDFTLDHIIPVAMVLDDMDRYDISLLWDPSNLQAAHMSCNGRKGDTQTEKQYSPPKHARPPIAGMVASVIQ